MSKLATSIAMALVTLGLVFCVLAAIAAVDEFARLPFYYTLPISALLVNGAWMFLLLRKRGRMNIFGSSFARLASRGATFRTRPFSFGAAQPQDISRSVTNRTRGYRRGSPQEIQAALRKVHSVAWNFPRRTPIVDPMNQEEHANDEAHR